MGELVPGSFPIPSNPILLGTAQRTGLKNLGDLVAASFPLPQNPITAATSMDRPKILTPADGKNALMRSLTAAKTGPVSSGIGQVDAASTLQSIGQVLDNTITVQGIAIPYWVLAIGGIAIIGYLATGKQGPNRFTRFKAAH
jgi:hypothetical protein